MCLLRYWQRCISGAKVVDKPSGEGAMEYTVVVVAERKLISPGIAYIASLLCCELVLQSIYGTRS